MSEAGRPPTPGQNAAQRAHAAAEKTRYASLPRQDRQRIVQTRDRGAQQAADNRRHESQRDARNAMHSRTPSSTGAYPERERARAIARAAVDGGAIPKTATCQNCGRRPATELHHADYAQPLSVSQDCTTCHGHLDRHAPGSGRG